MFVLFGSYLLLVEGSSQACISPQYVELGRTATISCNFERRFYGVFWFNTTNITSSERPFMIITESQKSGRGYTSGEFDIKDNGSLIINKVSLQHDISFTVNVLYTSDGDPNIENVRVIVYAIPKEPYPVIDGCGRNGICYRSANTEFTVNCSVQDSRPPASLMFLLKTSEGDFSLSSNKTTIRNGIYYTTLIQATIRFNETNRLLLISCQGGIVPHTEKEATFLIENNQNEPLPVVERLNVEVGSNVILPCGEYDASYFVWKEKGRENTIAVGLGSLYGYATNIYNSEFQVADQSNSLVIPSFEKEHEGTYICVISNGITTVKKMFEVIGNDTTKGILWWAIVIVLLLLVLPCFAAAVIYRLKKIKDKKTTETKGNETSVPEKIPMLKNDTDKKKFCSSEDIVFRWNDLSKEKHTEDHDNMIKLLIHASDKKMEVKYVKLLDCFKSVNDSAEHICLVSGKRVPVIKSLEELVFYQSKKPPKKIDLEKILQYAIKCDRLNTLRFDGFLMPYISNESGTLCNIVKGMKMEVEWVSNTTFGRLVINKDACCWQKKTEKTFLYLEDYDKLIMKMTTNVSLGESACA